MLQIKKRRVRSKSSKIKSKARRSLQNKKITRQSNKYVIDTSVAVNKSLGKLIAGGLKGTILVPNAVMAELENLANKGIEAGFIGLEQIAKIHKFSGVKLRFTGLRPTGHQIRYAKSGEIDAIVRETAFKNKAILITSDLVQAKSAQAYGAEVHFIKVPKVVKPKKRFSFFGRK